MSGMPTGPYQDWAKQKLGFEYSDIQLLITALTHRSYVNEHRKSVSEHNERLEFLGDAVLELVVTDYLFQHYSEPEGILTSWRAALVNTISNAESGRELGYEPLVRMSKGEKHGSDRARRQILANAYEAVIGSIYLERGYDDAAAFIQKYTIVKLDKILGATQKAIYKKLASRLIAQRRFTRFSLRRGQTTIKYSRSAHMSTIR